MGEANRRGSFEERQATAIKRKQLARAEELKLQAERRRLQDEYAGILQPRREEMMVSRPTESSLLAAVGLALAAGSMMAFASKKVDPDICHDCEREGVAMQGVYDSSIHDGTFAVHCPRCGLRTEDKMSWPDAVDAWNSGDTMKVGR